MEKKHRRPELVLIEGGTGGYYTNIPNLHVLETFTI